MRIPFIAGNWKMFKTKAEAIAFAEEFRELYKDTDVQTAICAPFTNLKLERSLCRNGNQSWCTECTLCRRGSFHWRNLRFHAGRDRRGFLHRRTPERRQYFGETDETVNKKLKKLFEGPIRPILCVGESLEERDADKAFDVVGGQIKAYLEGIDAADVKKLVIAYEPIWAIGTGRTATPEQAEEMCAFIRKTLIELYGEEVSDEVIIQYGGSVKTGQCNGDHEHGRNRRRSGRRRKSSSRKISWKSLIFKGGTEHVLY